MLATDDTQERRQPWRVEQVLPFPDSLDLALITFRTADEDCPYKSLPLGDSEQLSALDDVYTVGYPIRQGEQQLVKQIAELKISAIEPPSPEGYGISFSGTTAGGMSGGPLLDRRGRVVAVHGKTDSELVPVGDQEQSGESVAPEPAAELETSSQMQRVEHFKWAVPIELVQDRLEAVLAAAPPPSDSTKLRQQGWQHWEAGNYPAMLAAFEQAVQLNAADAEAWSGRGTALWYLEQYEEALAAYDKALAINPDYADAWYSRGIALRQSGQNEEAIASYDKALAINPDFASPWDGKAYILVEQERYQEALEAVNNALKIDPNLESAQKRKQSILNKL